MARRLPMAGMRLLAMLPSLFTPLGSSSGYARSVLGGSLNVATIIIATAVLGTTEHDQLHFFLVQQLARRSADVMHSRSPR